MKNFILLFAILFYSFQTHAQIITPSWAWSADYTGDVISSCYHNNYVYVIGNYNSSVQIGSVLLPNAGGYDTYVAKWDTLGNLIWAKSISDAVNETAIAININSNNEIVVAGNHTNARLEIGNDTLITGAPSGTYVATYDLNGNLLDAFGISSVSCTDFCLDNASNIYINTSDGLKKFTSTGAFVWQKPYGAAFLRYSNVGSCIMGSGTFTGTLNFGAISITNVYSSLYTSTGDVYAVQFDLNGNVNWAQNLTNYPRLDFARSPYLHASTGDLYLPIMTLVLNGRYANIRRVTLTGASNNIGYYGYIDPMLQAEITSISGKDSFCSFALGFAGVPQVIGVYNINQYQTNLTMKAGSNHHLFENPNAIYMTGMAGTISHTYGKVDYQALTSANTFQTMHKCIGSTVNLVSNANGGILPLTYSWTPSIGLSSINTDTTSFIASTNISYILTVTDAIGQVVNDTFEIIIDTPFNPLTITPQYSTFCQDSMYLISSIDSGINWYLFNGLSWVTNASTYLNDSIIIYGPGFFRVRASNACNTVADTLQIFPATDIIANVTAINLCQGQSVTLTGGGGVSYSWSGGVTNNISFIPVLTQTYTVTGIDTSGCIDTASVNIKVNPVPSIASVTATPSSICNSQNSLLELNLLDLYCTPQAINSGLSGSYISMVVLGGSLYTSGDGPGDYNYYSSSNANFEVGLTLNNYIAITRNFEGSAIVRRNVWVDLDHDGNFNDTTELLFSTVSNNQTVGAYLLIPSTALNGQTRMRVSGSYSSSTPCLIDQGEFEDYNITISNGVDVNIQWFPTTFLSASNSSPIQANSVISTTTYTATITSQYGCSNSDTVTLTVIPTNTSLSNIIICSTALPYIWNTQSLTATGIYTAIFTNALGCDSVAALNLIVNSTSTSTTDTTICSTDLPFVWNTLSLTSSGNYTANFINVLGCDSVAALNLIVNSTSTSTTDTTICSSALPYVWNSQTLTSSGIYTSSLTNYFGCDSITSLNLVVNPNPQPTIIQNNYTLICTNASNVNYQWYFNGVTIGGNDSVLTITQDGQYVVMITDSAGCIGYDTLTVIGLSVDEIDDDNLISIYPNPTTGQLTIELNLDESCILSLKLLDVQGRTLSTIMENKKLVSGTYHQVINLKSLGLTPGIYLLSGHSANHHWTKRIVYFE